MEDNRWCCNKCTFINHQDLLYCEECNERRTGEPSPPEVTEKLIAEKCTNTVRCDYQNCGERVLLSEYAVHQAKHITLEKQLKQRTSQNPQNINFEHAGTVLCDFKHCGERVLFSEYQFHQKKHLNQRRNNNKPHKSRLTWQKKEMETKDDCGHCCLHFLYDIFSLLYNILIFTQFQAMIVTGIMAILVAYAQDILRWCLWFIALIIVIMIWNVLKYILSNTKKGVEKIRCRWNNNMAIVWILFIIVFIMLFIVICNQLILFENDNTIFNALRGHSVRILNLENDMKYVRESLIYDIQTELSHIKGTMKENAIKVDKKFDGFQKEIQKSYENFITKSETAKWADEVMMATIGKIKSNPRKWIGIGGCFSEGTQILVGFDAITGAPIYVKIEDLRNGDLVYNPFYDKQMKIDKWIYGYESGIMYNITTNDLLSVVVTEKHPIIVCNDYNNDVQLSECMSFAAKDVFVGNDTLTMNDIEKIIKIEEIKVKNILVYNFMYDEKEISQLNDKLLLFRGINANGIYTLDLHAQSLLEKQENQDKEIKWKVMDDIDRGILYGLLIACIVRSLNKL